MKKTLYTLALATISFCAQAQFNNKATLNGSTDYIEIPASSALALPSDATVEAFVRPIAPGSTGYVFINCVQPDNWGVYLAISGGTAQGAVVVGGNQYTITDGTPLPLLTFSHIAVVRNGTSLQLYVNGSLAAATTIPSGSLRGSSTSVSRIGRVQNGSGGFFLGTIDDVRIWSVARTSTQIANSLSSELSGSESNLVAYYKMNENGAGAGITVNNSATSTGTSLNATTYGTVATPIFSIVALPVKLVSFNASRVDQQVRVNWETSSEANIAAYDIERSLDGIIFERVATVEARNGNSTSNKYAVTDYQQLNGAFYRLKIVGRGGEVSFSKVVRINSEASGSSPVVTENPVVNTLHISSVAHVDAVTIFDMNGRNVKSLAASGDGSYDVSDLSAGVYIARIQYDGGIATARIVKQ